MLNFLHATNGAEKEVDEFMTEPRNEKHGKNSGMLYSSMLLFLGLGLASIPSSEASDCISILDRVCRTVSSDWEDPYPYPDGQNPWPLPWDFTCLPRGCVLNNDFYFTT